MDVSTNPAIDKFDFDLNKHLEEKMFEDFRKKYWEAIEHILHTHIDNPIVGEITKEKLRAADIQGLIHSEDAPDLEVDTTDPLCVRMILHSSLLGVRQGDMLIQENGNRMPVDKIPVRWYEEHFIYD